MLAALGLATLQFGTRHLGFYGIEGFAGLVIGLIIFIVIAAILWKIMTLALPKLVTDATWQQVITWLIILLLFLFFLHTIGLY